MADNQFLPVAVGGIPNVQDQASYAASNERIQGWPIGAVPSSSEWNKMLRQATTMVSQLAQMGVDITGLDFLDDGDMPILLANLKTMLQSSSKLLVAADNGSVVNAYVFELDPPLLANVAGLPIKFQVPAANTGPSTVNFGTGVKNLLRPGGHGVLYHDLTPNVWYTAVYNGAAYEVEELLWAATVGSALFAPTTVANDGVAHTIATIGAVANTNFGNFSVRFDDGGATSYSANVSAFAGATTVTPGSISSKGAFGTMAFSTAGNLLQVARTGGTANVDILVTQLNS